MTPKSDLRSFWKAALRQIPLPRRAEAAASLKNHPFKRGVIASFSSFEYEIDTSPLNALLASKKSLALPRVENDNLFFYLEDLKKLTLSKWGLLTVSLELIHT